MYRGAAILLIMFVALGLGFTNRGGRHGASMLARALSMNSVVEEVQSKISSNKVMVFSKSYCPFCVRAKGALKDLGLEFEVEELDKVKGGSETQGALLEMTGQRTVPNVFINGKHLGGCDDTLAAIRSGQLQKMLE